MIHLQNHFANSHLSCRCYHFTADLSSHSDFDSDFVVARLSRNFHFCCCCCCFRENGHSPSASRSNFPIHCFAVDLLNLSFLSHSFVVVTAAPPKHFCKAFSLSSLPNLLSSFSSLAWVEVRQGSYILIGFGINPPFHFQCGVHEIIRPLGEIQ
jgi:hypothetical protein